MPSPGHAFSFRCKKPRIRILSPGTFVRSSALDTSGMTMGAMLRLVPEKPLPGVYPLCQLRLVDPGPLDPEDQDIPERSEGQGGVTDICIRVNG